MSVAVDGAQRYVWPVSTGRPGYDTPSGSFKPNRMDADHYSQEWDNAPMPHAIFFDMDGHAFHGFFDAKHLGRAVSHGCVRLSPDHAQTLFTWSRRKGWARPESWSTPGGDNAPVARSRLPLKETVSSEPVQVAPGYGRESSPYSGDRASGQLSYGQAAYDQSYQPGYAQRPYARRIRASPTTGSRIMRSRVMPRLPTRRSHHRPMARQATGSGDDLRLANCE